MQRLRRHKRESSKPHFTPFRHLSTALDLALADADAPREPCLLLHAVAYGIDQATSEHGLALGLHRYYDKHARTDTVCFMPQRREWALRRNLTWVPDNAKHDRLRSALRDLTEVATTRHAVAVHAPDARHVLFLYSDGTLVSVSTTEAGNINHARVDRTLARHLDDRGLGAVVDACFLPRACLVSLVASPALILAQLGPLPKAGSSSGVGSDGNLTGANASTTGPGRRLGQITAVVEVPPTPRTGDVLPLPGASGNDSADSREATVAAAVFAAATASAHGGAGKRARAEAAAASSAACLCGHANLILQWWPTPPGRDALSPLVLHALHPSGNQLLHLQNYGADGPIVHAAFSRADPRLFYVLVDCGPSAEHGFSARLTVCRARLAGRGSASTAAAGAAGAATAATGDGSATAGAASTSGIRAGAEPAGSIELLRQIMLHTPAPLCTFGVSHDDRFVLFAAADGHVTLATLHVEGQRPVHASSAVRDPVAVAWHSSHQLVTVASRKGVVQCFDIALQPVPLALAEEKAEALPYLDLDRLHLAYAGVAGCQWAPPSPQKLTAARAAGAQAEAGTAPASATGGGIGSTALTLLLSGGAPLTLYLHAPMSALCVASVAEMLIADRLHHGQVRLGEMVGSGSRTG